MKNFTKNNTWINKTTLEIRWIYTLFIAFALIGHLSFILIAASRVGPGYDDIVQHYRGGDSEEEMAFPKEFIELLEVTHFHAYIEGIVLLVLAHLYVAVPHSRQVKLVIIGVSFGSTLLDLISPWLIRYLTAYAAYGQIGAWIGMSISYLPLTLAPLYYMWKK